MKKIVFLAFLAWTGLFAQQQPVAFQWLDSGTDAALSDVYCISADTVVVVGYRKVLRTVDGGTHWDSVQMPVEDYFMKLHFVDSRTGYILGRRYVLKTLDGGLHWQTIRADSVNARRTADYLSVLNTDTVFIIRSDTALWMTPDGGNHWQSVRIPDSGNVNTVQFLNAQTGFLTLETLDHVYLLRTDDTARTWQPVDTLPIPVNYTLDMDILSPDTMYISHWSGIIKSVDGGHQWTEILRDTTGMEYNGAILSTVVPSYRHIWSVGFMPLICREYPVFIYHNPDGGDSFDRVEFYAENSIDDYGRNNMFTGLHFADTLTGYVVGLHGKILKISQGQIFDVPAWLQNYFVVYPNPASGVLHFKYPEDQTIDLALADNNGRMIRPFAPLNGPSMDISRLKPGFYTLLVRYRNRIFGIDVIINNRE